MPCVTAISRTSLHFSGLRLPGHRIFRIVNNYPKSDKRFQKEMNAQHLELMRGSLPCSGCRQNFAQLNESSMKLLTIKLVLFKFKS